MKLSALLATLLAALFLTACGEKTAEAPAAEPAPTAEVTPAAAVEVAPTPAAVPVAGGYEPTAEERVPGITRTQEEQDKINAASQSETPLPVIPGEAPAEATPPAAN